MSGRVEVSELVRRANVLADAAAVRSHEYAQVQYVVEGRRLASQEVARRSYRSRWSTTIRSSSVQSFARGAPTRRLVGAVTAVARGRRGGRPVVMTPERVEFARKMRADGKSYRGIGEALRVGASTVQLHLARAG